MHVIVRHRGGRRLIRVTLAGNAKGLLGMNELVWHECAILDLTDFDFYIQTLFLSSVRCHTRIWLRHSGNNPATVADARDHIYIVA